MRRRIVLLVAATTSAVVVGFLVPMCLLIINLANDRAESQAREQAQLVAGLIASVPDDTTLAAAVSSISRAGLVVTVVRADEDLIGASSLTDDTRTSVQRARKDRQPFTATMDHGLDAVVPVTTTNGVDVVIATVPSGQVNRGVPAAITTICTIGALLIVGATLLARQLARRVTTPVTAVAATAHRLREGELTARARVGGPPETVELATALNALAERIEDLLDAERECCDELLELLEPFGSDAIANAWAVDFALHEPRVLEHLQMLRHRRLRERQRAHDLAADALTFLGELPEDRDARGMPERFRHLGELLVGGGDRVFRSPGRAHGSRSPSSGTSCFRAASSFIGNIR